MAMAQVQPWYGIYNGLTQGPGVEFKSFWSVVQSLNNWAITESKLPDLCYFKSLKTSIPNNCDIHALQKSENKQLNAKFSYCP